DGGAVLLGDEGESELWGRRSVVRLSPDDFPPWLTPLSPDEAEGIARGDVLLCRGHSPGHFSSWRAYNNAGRERPYGGVGRMTIAHGTHTMGLLIDGGGCQAAATGAWPADAVVPLLSLVVKASQLADPRWLRFDGSRLHANVPADGAELLARQVTDLLT